jgi:hypothetical protein
MKSNNCLFFLEIRTKKWTLKWQRKSCIPRNNQFCGKFPTNCWNNPVHFFGIPNKLSICPWRAFPIIPCVERLTYHEVSWVCSIKLAGWCKTDETFDYMSMQHCVILKNVSTLYLYRMLTHMSPCFVTISSIKDTPYFGWGSVVSCAFEQ